MVAHDSSWLFADSRRLIGLLSFPSLRPFVFASLAFCRSSRALPLLVLLCVPLRPLPVNERLCVGGRDVFEGRRSKVWRGAPCVKRRVAIVHQYAVREELTGPLNRQVVDGPLCSGWCCARCTTKSKSVACCICCSGKWCRSLRRRRNDRRHRRLTLCVRVRSRRPHRSLTWLRATRTTCRTRGRRVAWRRG